MSGFAEWELSLTSFSEKSDVTKAWTNTTKAKPMSANCMSAALFATSISASSPRCAPTIGTTICTSATASARISAKCPSSAIIF